MVGIKSSFWPPPWSLLILAAIGLIVWWYCKKHCINFYVLLSLFTSSSNHNNQENLKKYKKNNNKNVSFTMSDGNGPVLSLLSTKKSRQSFVIGGITALVATFLVYAVLSNLSFKAQHEVVEVSDTLPSSLPLGLPPPNDIFGEVAIEEASLEYKDISSSFSPHTHMARASFLKDKAVSLLRGATVQTFLVSLDSKEGEEDLDDCIVLVGTPKVASGSADSLSSFKSGFQHVGLKGYDQMTFEISGRVRTLFQSLGQSDGGPSSSAFFSMASLRSKTVGFLSGANPVQDIFEKSVEDTSTVSLSASDEFSTQTEDCRFIGNMDVGELKPDTSINYDSCSCPTDVHLWYKHLVDKDGDGQRLGLTKWTKRVLLTSSSDARDGYCMIVSEASGDCISINSYQNGVSNPTTLGGLDVDSATTKASLLKVFSDKCIGFFKGLGKKEAKKAFNYPMAAALLLLLLKVFVILSHSACSGSLKAKKKNCKVKNRVSKRLLYSFMRISALFISLGRVVVSDMTAADIEQVGDDVAVEATKPYSIGDGMRRLNEFSHSLLRGRTGQGEGEVNPLEAVSIAKEVLQAHVDNERSKKEKLLSSNDDEEVLALLTSHVDERKTMAQIATEGAHNVLDSLSLATQNEHDIQALLSGGHMDKEEVANFFFDDGMIDDMQYNVDALEGIENDLMPHYNYHRRTSKNNDQQKKFQPKSHASAAPNLSFGKRSHKKLPKLKVVEQLKAKRGIHGRRRLEEELAPQCRKKCDEENEDSYKCNCQRLSDCAKDLTWYDMAVRTLGGYVQSDPDTDGYGELNTEMEYINVFDARNGMGDKIKSIRDLASEPMTKETCHHLLEELHTACNADSCVNPNEHSLQLSVDDTCRAVNTRTKLKVKVMGEYYDFRNWIVQGGKPRNTVFVTSESYRGNLGGVAGADEKCQAHANKAGLGGIYKAWISDSTLSPSNRFFQSILPYFLVDGTKIANNWVDLSDGSISSQINIDENGLVLSNGLVWTNTLPNGRPKGSSPSDNCDGWTSGDIGAGKIGAYGSVARQDSKWSDLDRGWCYGPSRLYCFQQDAEETPLNTEHAVRCCKDDSPIIDIDYELWSQKKANCPFTMNQLWTGESQEKITQDSVLGYTLYPNRKCDDSNTIVLKKASSLDMCQNNCNYFSDCVSFEYTPYEFRYLDAGPRCETSTNPGTSLTQAECEEAGIKLGLGPVRPVSDEAHPCGCFLWRWESGQKELLFDAGTTCGKDAHTEGMVCKNPKPCAQSSSCNHFDLTELDYNYEENPPPKVGSDWYFKHWSIVPPGYTKYENRTCGGDVPRPGTRTTQECANSCSLDAECVSFSINVKTQSCLLSKTCTDYAETEEDMSDTSEFVARFNWYLKEDDDNQGDEECLFLTYDKAKEYCEDAGGRVCTKAELEDGCAAFTGCSFDTSLVWSSSEAKPEVCPATSYSSGWDFISAFDSLYNGRDTTMFEAGNPMQIDQDKDVEKDFENVQFPTGFVEEVAPNGIAKIKKVNGQSVYLYDYENILSTTEDLYCDAKLGPPSLLAQAIDASMNFLLGPRVSIGFLNSTAVAVNSFDPPFKKVFVTSETYTGNLGGVAGADEKCQTLADKAGLGGTYKAWISDNTLSPSNRFKRSTSPYFLVDGTKIADDWVDLSDGSISSQINIDENGFELFSGLVWTNTLPNGRPKGSSPSDNCNGWTSGDLGVGKIGAYGSVARQDSKWSDLDRGSCLGPSRLYCFQQDADAESQDPRWLTWYTNLTDKDSIDFYNRWTSAYEKIEDDPEGDPIWLGDYLSILDPNPFIVSPADDEDDQSVLDELYCVDETAFSGSLETCQKSWLHDIINPYEDMSWYTSIPYPSSDDVDSPFNQTCDDADFCKVDWLENATNPYSESTNGGCYAFYNDCREADPERYRCKGFWEYCRTNLTDSIPGWKYPRENCTDTSTEDIVTCPEKWLDDKTNRYTDEREQNESCYNFWNYCREELNTTYPEWEYPRPTCKDDNGIEIETCLVEWLDNETNPYDSTTDSECYEFWGYCRNQLIHEFPRYVWPLPAEPTVDDFMPGYCCRDTPTTDRETKYWGDDYTEERANRGMKCKDRGEWHMGMSPEACHNGLGVFYRTACITLQRCIDARPREGEPGYRSTFEEWVIEEEIDIYDPYIEDQCETARVALDYDADYLNDQEICETFNELLCDEFFGDLQYLADEAGDGPTEFDQVKYKSIEYPKDKALFFKKLPKEIGLKSVSAETAEARDGTIDALEKAKKTLLFLKTTAMEAINKYADKADAQLVPAETKCKALEAKATAAAEAFEVTRSVCDGACDVLPLGGTNPACFPCRIKQSIARKVKMSITANFIACDVGLNFFEGVAVLIKAGLWAFHYAIKVGYDAVDTALFAIQIKESNYLREYDYVEATYDNVISQFEWVHGALGVMTNNQIRQHTQMRAELQSRHQDMTNDINQYTTCMSNYLGIQIFKAFGGKTSSLSPLCKRILGVGEGNNAQSSPLFSLDVEWTDESFIGQIVDMQESFSRIGSKNEAGDILDEMEVIKTAIVDIQTALGITPKSDTKSKKSKKAKGAKDDLFTRNLLESEHSDEVSGKDEARMIAESINEKLSSIKEDTGAVQEIKTATLTMTDEIKSVELKVEKIENKVEFIEGKVQSMESKVHSIGDKVDNMEKTMNDIKDMLSQLTTKETQ